jgi:hypothetical protein
MKIALIIALLLIGFFIIGSILGRKKRIQFGVQRFRQLNSKIGGLFKVTLIAENFANNYFGNASLSFINLFGKNKSSELDNHFEGKLKNGELLGDFEHYLFFLCGFSMDYDFKSFANKAINSFENNIAAIESLVQEKPNLSVIVIESLLKHGTDAPKNDRLIQLNEKLINDWREKFYNGFHTINYDESESKILFKELNKEKDNFDIYSLHVILKRVFILWKTMIGIDEKNIEYSTLYTARSLCLMSQCHADFNEIWHHIINKLKISNSSDIETVKQLENLLNK